MGPCCCETHHDGNSEVPDSLGVLHNAHPLQGHEAAVGVAVHHLSAHFLEGSEESRPTALAMRQRGEPFHAKKSTSTGCTQSSDAPFDMSFQISP